jgi:D-alanyl-lipoteichoic acid acyltransferase DltB (MBOAT superfamily)
MVRFTGAIPNDPKKPATQLLQSSSQAELNIASRKKLSLSEYVRRRNGVPLGASGSLKNMLRRSFGARSFAGFWQHWNPIFGYYLGKYVFVPLKRVSPPYVALILTFVVTGIIHDVVTMAVRQDVAFFFTPWFLFLGIGVVLSKMTGMDIGACSWKLRAVFHATYLGVCLALAFVVFTVR